MSAPIKWWQMLLIAAGCAGLAIITGPVVDRSGRQTPPPAISKRADLSQNLFPRSLVYSLGIPIGTQTACTFVLLYFF